MHEIELKFQVNAPSRAAVAKAVGTATAQTTRLQAIYFDTPDRKLARAGIALRLRKEGRRWVQTVKAASADETMRRIEHNVMLPLGTAPVLDLHWHDATEAEGPLRAALDGEEPVETFRTDIRRTHRLLRAKGGTVELAFDEGRTLAGDRVLKVCELEIELASGQPAALLDVARRWVQRHGLWLDVRSKAERGDRLARGLEIGTPRRAAPSPLTREMTQPEAWRAAIQTCLAQILPNASDIAGETHDAEHLHQLRIGLRRLRSLLRFLGDEPLQLSEPVMALLNSVFAETGAVRDRDAVAETLLPPLQKAGAPWIEFPAPDSAPHQALRARLRSPEVSGLWLELLAATLPELPAGLPNPMPLQPAADGLSNGDALPPMLPMPSLKSVASDRLRRLHRQIARESKGFLALSDETRHSIRKRAKRLRYSIEFAAPLFSRKKTKAYLKRLKPLQERLGEFNDLHVAESIYRQAAAQEARAWFVVGWITAQREEVLNACQSALDDFAKARRFWKG